MRASPRTAARSRSCPTAAPRSRRSRRRERPTKEREDLVQVHLLPLDRPGEARRLTDLPRGVKAFEWSPDGTRLVVVVELGRGDARRGHEAPRQARAARRPATPPPSDYRFIDRLEYMLNGEGFTYDQVAHLWLVDVASGAATRLTDGPVPGRRAGVVARRHADRVRLEPAARPRPRVPPGHPRRRRGVAPGHRDHGRPALGLRRAGLDAGRDDDRRARPQARGPRRQPQRHLAVRRRTARRRRASGGRNLSARHDLMPGSAMSSDVTVGEAARLWPAPDGRSITFTRADRRVVRAVADRHARTATSSG